MRNLGMRIQRKLAFSVCLVLASTGIALGQPDTAGTLIDVGTFTVSIPDVDDWSVNIDRDKGLVEFSRTKQKLLSLFSSGAGGGTSMKVFRDRLEGGRTPGLWVMNEQEMVTYVYTIELQSVAATSPGRRAEVTSTRMDSAIVDGKTYYRLEYSEVLKNTFAVESILHLYFPPEFPRTIEFFGFLINESYVSGSAFASKDLEQIWPLIRSLQTAGPASTLPGVGGDLLRVAASGDSARVTHLVEGGANVNSLPRDGRGPLALTALYGHESLAQYLVDRGANINPDKIFEIYSPLTSAILGREVRIAEFLLAKGAKANVFADSQWSPLIRAITMHLDTGFVATLLAHGADRNLGGDWSPLMHAANEGLPAVVTLLTDRGANLDLTDSNGVTALATALYRNQPEVAGILLTRGANPNATSKRGDSPLMLAAQSGDTVSLARLIQRGARVNATNIWGSPR